MWTQQQAIELCREVDDGCPAFGCHVALTGGCLYKTGPRKDIDLIFYRIRQKEIDFPGLFAALAKIGLVKTSGFGWLFKACYRGSTVDLLFPEEETGTYPGTVPAI